MARVRGIRACDLSEVQVASFFVDGFAGRKSRALLARPQEEPEYQAMRDEQRWHDHRWNEEGGSEGAGVHPDAELALIERMSQQPTRVLMASDRGLDMLNATRPRKPTGST